MKAVMYHYVRDPSRALEHQRYLHTRSFERQLDWIVEELGVVSRPRFDEALATGEPAPGAVLTFDDALRDHVDVVLPLLEERGLWGTFFVPTAPLRTHRLLAVHRLHHLVGTVAPQSLWALVQEVVDDDMLAHDHVEEFHTRTYGRVDDDAATDAVKRTLNYLIGDPHRDAVLDALVAAAGIDEEQAAAEHYLGRGDLARLVDAGMSVGSHSDAHLVMSTLSVEDQRADVRRSVQVLEEATGEPVSSFCYPFGGFHSFTADTEAVLREAGLRCAFNVEPRDIEARDLRHRPFALPRFDCNALPHGRAHRGRADLVG